MQVFSIAELGGALLQAVVTLGLALLCLYLYRRHHKRHFLLWSVALGVYFLSLGVIISFLVTGVWALLFWHQVFTAWTALGFLYAALVFSHHVRWRRSYYAVVALPVIWSYLAIFVLDDFGLAAGPAVVFLALATGWAGVVFWRYRRRTGSAAAGFLAVVLILWAAHHLDYPILRARGAWNPWGYYLDTLFILAMGTGILLLVIEELREGLVTLTALSGDLRRQDGGDSRDVLLERPLGLRGVEGAALVGPGPEGLEVVRAVGACGDWCARDLPARVAEMVWDVLGSGRSRLEGTPRVTADGPRFAAVLPLGAAAGRPMVLVIAGDLAAPFAALDDGILGVVGEQVGSALEHAELYRRLAQRTGDLERLSVRMLREHEDQRRRLGRELHDETAQVFSALKLQLGSLGEAADGSLAPRVNRLLELVAAGTKSIRNVTEGLRPAVLDDLGLLPAIRALIGDFREWSGVQVDFRTEGWEAEASLGPEAELAVFRAVQESLSNVARHAQASVATVVLAGGARAGVTLRVTDDGVGLAAADLERLESAPGRSGLFGLRERIATLGGTVHFDSSPGQGLIIDVRLPPRGA
ncbi:MAG: sensor histidine kinase [Gemmatimonadales bacterium]